MMYDDVDVNILDSKDTFGVFKSAEPKIPEEDKLDFNIKPKPSHKSLKRDSQEFKSQSKFTRKKLVDDDVEIVSETRLKFPRKKHEDDDIFEPKFKLGRNKKFDDDGRKKEDEVEKPKPIDTLSTEFMHKTAITFQEKLSVLEERDKYLRESVFKTGNKNMSVIVNGTCPDMCPEKERLLREIYCSFSVFEGQIVDNEMHVVPELLVKEYSRSSADQDEPLPHELRPEPVLIDTMNHIVVNIMPKIEENIDITEWYHFCWDRLRSLRKDIIQQQLCSRNIIQILEQSARFHICCGDLLFGADPKIFDEKINAENLVNCLQMLINMYEDLEKKGIKCENEYEFRVYMMLLLLDSGDIPDVIRWNDENSKQYAGQAKQIFFAFKQNLYTRFFKLVKRTSYLNACILQRYFSTVKSQILTVLVTSYSSGTQKSKFPLSFVKKNLEFDTDEETITFVESHGFVVDYDTSEVRGSKSTFVVPEIKVNCGSSYIVRSKRPSMLEAVSKIAGYTPKKTLSKVHSSFNEYDKLKEKAWKAEDQKEKVIRLFGDIYSQSEEDTIDAPSRTPTPKNISPTRSFSFNIEPKPISTFIETPKENAPSEDVLPSFTFKKPEAPEPLIKHSPPAQSTTMFFFNAPKFDPKPQSPIEPAPLKIEPIKIISPAPIISPKTISPELTEPELYDPAEATASSDEEEPYIEPVNEPVAVRNPEQVVDNLTNALKQFQTLYSNFFESNRQQAENDEKLRLLRENKRLRRTVKKRLKRNNAKKYARIWKQKIDIVRKKRDDFVDVVHLPLDEYFSLWGTLKTKDDLPKSIVKYTADAQRTAQWSSNILTGKCLSVNYIGDKMAELLVNSVRIRSSMLKLKMKTILCWKVLVYLPSADNDSFRSFCTKVSEFCQVLFYKNKNLKLQSVENLETSGVRICSSIDVKSGPIQKIDDVAGITSLVMYVCDKQETFDQFKDRLCSVMCNNVVHPIHVNVIAVNNCYKENINDLLTRLKKAKRIISWNITKWENFFTVPKVVLNGARYSPWTPSFEVKSLTDFIETTGGDFFLNLCYLWNKSLPNSPVTYINLYNTFLNKLREALVTETPRKYNLSAEFLPNIINSGDNTRNTLTNPELISLISKYTLIGFTKWPPKTVAKIITLLSKYCEAIDKEDRTFLPNVLRLVSPREDIDAETISENAPWIKVVELWSRYNVNAVLKRENDLKNVFVVYDESKIKQIADGLWIYNTTPSLDRSDSS